MLYARNKLSELDEKQDRCTGNLSVEGCASLWQKLCTTQVERGRGPIKDVTSFTRRLLRKTSKLLQIWWIVDHFPACFEQLSSFYFGNLFLPRKRKKSTQHTMIWKKFEESRTESEEVDIVEIWPPFQLNCYVLQHTHSVWNYQQTKSVKSGSTCSCYRTGHIRFSLVLRRQKTLICSAYGEHGKVPPKHPFSTDVKFIIPSLSMWTAVGPLDLQYVKEHEVNTEAESPGLVYGRKV